MDLEMAEDGAADLVLDLAAIAEIVRGLITGEPARLGDGAWLRERAAIVGLSRLAYEALEALRRRLGDEGAPLLSATALLNWN